MKGKILEIDGTGSWKSEKYGEMFTYMVRIQTDDQIYTGEANAKSGAVADLPYKIGDEVEFEHEPNVNPSFPDKMKIKKEGNYEGSENHSGKAKSNNEEDPNIKKRIIVMSYAKDLAIARMENRLGLYDTNWILEQADKLISWVDN